MRWQGPGCHGVSNIAALAALGEAWRTIPTSGRYKKRPGGIAAAGPVVEFIQTHHNVCQVVAFTARRAEFRKA